MLLVHQMAKVASQSWVEAAVGAAAARPAHCHYVTPTNRDRITAALTVRAGEHTIDNGMLVRDLLRTGAATWDRLQAARREGHPVRVVTGVRDPVGRSVSMLVFMADFYGHVSLPLSPRRPTAPDVAIDLLHRTWSQVLEGTEPSGTFEWFLWYMIRAYRTWFDEEFAPVYDLDVLAHAYHGAGTVGRLREAAVDALIYRVEDMPPASAGHALLLRQAGEFFGTPVPVLPNVNANDARRSRDAAATIRERFRLPAPMLEAIYETKVVRHFYTAEEIATFKAHWREAA